MSLLLVGSVNAHVGFRDAMNILQSGGSAIDAVVAAIAKVEANPDDHSVGFGGLPNLEGEVELDASLMDGRTLETGAVAALHGYQDAIALARVVMDELPHVLVVGSGASRLANEAGFQRQDLLTPETIVRVLDRIQRDTAFATFYNALPIAGVDGTIDKRMKGTPAEGNVRAKTGTLSKARSLSGYVTTADGERLIFSVLANNTTTPGSVVTGVADQIGAALAAYLAH